MLQRVTHQNIYRPREIQDVYNEVVQHESSQIKFPSFVGKRAY